MSFPRASWDTKGCPILLTAFSPNRGNFDYVFNSDLQRGRRRVKETERNVRCGHRQLPWRSSSMSHVRPEYEFSFCKIFPIPCCLRAPIDAGATWCWDMAPTSLGPLTCQPVPFHHLRIAEILPQYISLSGSKTKRGLGTKLIKQRRRRKSALFIPQSRGGAWPSPVKAPGLGPGDRRFESCRPDYKSPHNVNGLFFRIASHSTSEYKHGYVSP